MKFDKWLISMKMQPKEFSEKSGISVPTVYRILRGGKMFPSTAYKIVNFTKDEVAYEDLMGYDKQKD
jgi:predicted transcriptional regulator